MLCPKCSSPNPNGAKECEVCGVIFAHARRAQEQQARAQSALCAWIDQGRPCPCRGILSEGQNGSGSWYCREHWERLHRREPYGAGNALAAEAPKSMAAQKWREQWKAKYAETKVVDRVSPGEKMPNPLEAA